MKSRIKWNTIALAVLLICISSCGASGCHDWGNAPRTEYYIQGGDVTFKPATAVDSAITDFVYSNFNQRDLFMDLWRVDADDSDERYKIQPGYVSGNSHFYWDGKGETEDWEYYGVLSVDGSTLGFDLDFTNPWNADDQSAFTNLRAWGSCNYDDAQRLIKQVRLPAWSDNSSTDTAEVAWELTGSYNGQPFSVSFTQVFYGKSRYPVYPNY